MVVFQRSWTSDQGREYSQGSATVQQKAHICSVRMTPHLSLSHFLMFIKDFLDVDIYLLHWTYRNLKTLQNECRLNYYDYFKWECSINQGILRLIVKVDRFWWVMMESLEYEKISVINAVHRAIIQYSVGQLESKGTIFYFFFPNKHTPRVPPFHWQ